MLRAGGGVYPGWCSMGGPGGVYPGTYPVWYCQGPTHRISWSQAPTYRSPGTHIQVPRHPYTGSHNHGPEVNNHGPEVNNHGPEVKTVSNRAKQCSKQCQTGPNSAQNSEILRFLRCTLGIARPYDWNMAVWRPSETCIPTAWYLPVHDQTVIF